MRCADQVWDGLLYVASFTTDAIHMYDLDTGKFVDFFGNEDELDCPEGMEFGPDGTLYVVSFLADEVVRCVSTSTRARWRRQQSRPPSPDTR